MTETFSKPEVLCIGAQKAGTSWLYVVLSERKDIWVPPFKEQHFFDYKFIPEYRKWIQWHLSDSIRKARERQGHNPFESPHDIEKYFEKIATPPLFNGNWYKDVFSIKPNSAIGIDITPEYSVIPEEGVRFAKNYLGDSKVIVMGRDPVDRAISNLRMNLGRRKNTNPSAEDLFRELDSSPDIIRKSQYTEFVPMWEREFGIGNTLYLPYDGIRTDPKGIINRVEEFLSLERFNHERLEREVNVSPKFRIPSAVVDRLEKDLADQRDFFESKFM